MATAEDAARLARAGYDLALIGSALMTTADPVALLQGHDRRRAWSALSMAFIKICGMTDAGAVQAALAAGVDAIGFVFAKSVRQVTPAQAAQLAAPARGKALCVAVTLHPAAALLQEILEEFRPDVLQTDVDDMADAHLPASVATWPVLRGMPTELAPASLAPGQPLLFEGPRSGTGKVADWSAARSAGPRASRDPRRRPVTGERGRGHRAGAALRRRCVERRGRRAGTQAARADRILCNHGARGLRAGRVTPERKHMTALMDKTAAKHCWPSCWRVACPMSMAVSVLTAAATFPKRWCRPSSGSKPP